MKKIVCLFMTLVLSTIALTGCSDHTEPFTQESYTASAQKIKEIHVDVQDRSIEVSPSDDDQIHIAYFENSKEFYEISVSDDGVLTMSTATDKDWSDYIGGKTKAENRKISLQIPDALLTELNLSTTNEDISLSAMTAANAVSLYSSGGNLSFEKLDAEDSIQLRAKNGTIDGSIAGHYEDYAITCEIKKGDSNLPADKDAGDKKLQVSNNNGDIHVEFQGE